MDGCGWAHNPLISLQIFTQKVPSFSYLHFFLFNFFRLLVLANGRKTQPVRCYGMERGVDGLHNGMEGWFLGEMGSTMLWRGDEMQR